LRSNSLGKHSCQVYIPVLEKTARKFRSFAEAEKRGSRFLQKSLPAPSICGFWWSFLTMGLSKDWKEFLELLNSRGVDYVIIGAHSLALHGRSRYTGDLLLKTRDCLWKS
jgi:hypothetical protein